MQGVEKYRWPSRIRTDHVGETCWCWNVFRGHDRGSALLETSTPNQRIKHLWRDVFR